MTSNFQEAWKRVDQIWTASAGSGGRKHIWLEYFGLPDIEEFAPFIERLVLEIAKSYQTKTDDPNELVILVAADMFILGMQTHDQMMLER